MKKALKILMLAVLIVPCALVFSACNKNISNSDLTRYVYDSYKKVVTTEKWDTWQDLKMTEHFETTTDGQAYYEVGEESVLKDTSEKTVFDLEIQRKGQKEDTVIYLKGTATTTSVNWLPKDETTLSKVETTETTTVTLYLGRVGDKDTGKYYAVELIEKSASQSVDGVEDKDYVNDEEVGLSTPAEKYYYEYEQVTDFQAAVENVNSLIQGTLSAPYMSLGALQEAEAQGANVKRTQNGKKVTVDLSMDPFFTDNALTSAKQNYQFNDYNVTSYETTMKMEGFTEQDEDVVDMNMVIGVKANFEYRADATMLTEDKFSDYKQQEIDLTALGDIFDTDIM